ncbi:MAG: TonB family protein [Gammaproteobacteria bacterium]|nr:MAG: TonB family protein [Gammaproteobacteria bacterium]
MTACVASPVLPWTFSLEDERRFRRILRTSLVVFLALSLVMPLLPLPEIDKHVEEDLPPRMAKLLLQKQPPPPPPAKPEPVIPKPKPLPKKVEQPKPVPKKAEAPKPEPKKVEQPKPVVAKRKPVKQQPTARQQAEQAGLLALKDTLADLRQNTAANSFSETRAQSYAGGRARKTERALLTAGTTHGSGGIRTAGLSRNTGGGALAGHTTTQVHSPGGNAVAQTVGGKGKGARQAGRSIEEIQMVFDRNKGAIYSVYNRALRKDPTLQGKVVLQLTIAPSGKVTLCKLLSSELHDAMLGEKITQRVKLFDFGAKDVETVTITYPIDFLPA